MSDETVHATAVLIGNRAALIRGPAGSGKTRLAFALIDAARAGALPFARLVADDRVRLSAVHGRLIAAAPDAIGGLAEVRGLGIRAVAHEARAVVGLVIDLAAADGGRMAAEAGREIVILGVKLPRLAVAAGQDPSQWWSAGPQPLPGLDFRPLPSHMHIRNMSARRRFNPGPAELP